MTTVAWMGFASRLGASETPLQPTSTRPNSTPALSCKLDFIVDSPEMLNDRSQVGPRFFNKHATVRLHDPEGFFKGLF
jgi:hypothetical protein